MKRFVSNGINYTVLPSGDLQAGSNESTLHNAFQNLVCQNAVTLGETVKDGDVTYTLTHIGSHAFSDCGGSLTYISLPNSIVYIGYDAFARSSISLDTLTLPTALKSMSSFTFFNTKIKNFILPDSLQSIGSNPFYSYVFCSCYVSNKNPYFSIDSYGALYDSLYSVLFSVPTNITVFALPDTVVKICPHSLAFTIITTLTLPQSTESLDELFIFHSKIRSLTITGNLKKVTHSAFGGATNIQKVNYLGVKAVTSAISKSTDFLIVVCNSYKGTTFGNQNVTRNGLCPSFNHMVKCCSHQHTYIKFNTLFSILFALY